MKASPECPQNLHDQITAYQGNYLDIAALMEDSKLKADALIELDEVKRQMREVTLNCIKHRCVIRFLYFLFDSKMEDKHAAAEFQSFKKRGDLLLRVTVALPTHTYRGFAERN